jgi:hypothetical protein
MKWLIALFLLVLTGSGVGLAWLDGRFDGHEQAVRSIHYAKPDPSSQRRPSAER